MSFFELLEEGLEVMLLGLGTVFIVLVALIFVIEIINRLVNRNSVTKDKVSPADKAVDAVIKMEEKRLTEDSSIEMEDNDELIAIISAAVASSLSLSTHDIVVKSIRRLPCNTPSWNRVSRQEQIATRI